ncbi:MAG TPA: HEAT repeat domain-containing protein [Gemmatimonadales bacterium]
MRDETKLAVLLGRLLDLMMRSPEISDDHRTTLGALVEFLGRRSASLVVENERIAVEGEDIPDDTPFVSVLRDRLALHGVARLHLAHGASTVDVVELLRGLVASPAPGRPARALADRLGLANVVSVSVVSREAAAGAATRGAMRASAALKATQTPPAKRATRMDVSRAARSGAPTLASLVDRLQDGADTTPLLTRLDNIGALIVRAITANDLTPALEAILKLVRQEAEAGDPDTQRQYGITLRRLLTSEYLKKFAPLVFDEVYHDDIALLMRRAGKQGTKILLDLLIEAPSQAERLAYLKALRQSEEGADVIASLLSHHEWFVVRNAADLVGEMRIAEAVPALARAAQNAEPRVRRAIGIALARIGTAETALPLRKLVTDADPQVRLSVVKEVGGRALAGLGMPLVSAASTELDPDVLAEYYRALGRIGTPEAVAALVKAAQEGGGLLSRKPMGPRLAAIEGLGIAGGPSAVAVLRELAQGRSGDVRAVAGAALERAQAGAARA